MSYRRITHLVSMPDQDWTYCGLLANWPEQKKRGVTTAPRNTSCKTCARVYEQGIAKAVARALESK